MDDETHQEYIDNQINMLLGLKNRNNALNKLGEAYNNMLFQETMLQDGKQKWVDHVRQCIYEAMVFLYGAKIR